MNVPPMVLDLTVAPTDGRQTHVWLPLFLLWPFVLALGILALVFTIVADVVLLLLGQRYHHYTVLLVRSFAALSDTRGTVISVKDETTSFDMTIQ